MMSFLALICILACGVCWVYSFFAAHLALLICGGVFLLYLSIFFHEFGHLVGCFLLKRTVVGLYLYPVKFENGRISLTKTFKFSLRFIKGERDGFIHLFGPIFTLIQLGIAIVLSILVPNAHTLVFLVVSLVMLLGCVNDLSRLIRKNTTKD